MTYGKTPDTQRSGQSRLATAKSKVAPDAAKTSASTSAAAVAQEKRALEVLESASAGKGFDPYNSGAFDKRQTWERVIRK